MAALSYLYPMAGVASHRVYLWPGVGSDLGWQGAQGSGEEHSYHHSTRQLGGLVMPCESSPRLCSKRIQAKGE